MFPTGRDIDELMIARDGERHVRLMKYIAGARFALASGAPAIRFVFERHRAGVVAADTELLEAQRSRHAPGQGGRPDPIHVAERAASSPAIQVPVVTECAR